MQYHDNQSHQRDCSKITIAPLAYMMSIHWNKQGFYVPGSTKKDHKAISEQHSTSNLQFF